MKPWYKGKETRNFPKASVLLEGDSEHEDSLVAVFAMGAQNCKAEGPKTEGREKWW